MKTLIKYLAVFIAAFGIAGGIGYFGVTLFTKSAPEVILPDLTGKNIIQVLETLTRMGLNPKLYDPQYHDTIPKYGITFQDPKPGSTIKKGRDVIIYISKGFRESLVPDLRRLPLSEALLALEANELTPGRIAYVHTSDTLKGAVIAQYPLPAVKAAANAACNLLISKGPAPVHLVIPELRGLTLDEATGLLEELPVAVSDIRSEADTRLPYGEILRQEPAFGTRVPEGTGVALVVNNPKAGLVMPADRLTDVTWIPVEIPEGFSNRHIRVVTDVLGLDLDYINTYVKPGKNINLLIPGGIKTKIRIFIDHRLVAVKTIDPWNSDPDWNYDSESWTGHFYTGDYLWE
ncbi:MAG: PASTA domain-containing protein [Desulfobacterales bacterium]|nr:PASTA domain-containing protein [Desulfobacterales bacterium]